MAEEASSLVGIIETTVDIKSSTEKFFDMYVGQPHKIADASPSNVRGCELHDGETGQLGAVHYWNYVHDGEAKVMKARIDLIDLENHRVTYTVLEGDVLKEYKSFVISLQVTPKEGEPGSVAHWHFEYEKINEEVAHPQTLLQSATEVSKEVDEHLLSEE